MLSHATSFAVAFALLIAGSGAARAIEDESAASFFRADRERFQPAPRAAPIKQRPTHLIRRAAPVRGITLEDPATPPGAGAHPTRAPAAVPAIAAIPAPDDKPALAQRQPASLFTIAVLGDSLGVLLGQGLAETYADRSGVAVLR